MLLFGKIKGFLCSIYFIHVSHFNRFCRLILHPKIRRLDVSSLPKMLRDFIFKNLRQLCGLQVLNLGSCESGRKPMFSGLKYMRNLTSLTLMNECQNETLAILGQNCPSLQRLDVSCSSCVTDRGVTWLLRCKRLRDVNLYQTSIGLEMLVTWGRSHEGIRHLG